MARLSGKIAIVTGAGRESDAPPRNGSLPKAQR